MNNQTLVIDVGNTNTVFGLFSDEELIFHRRTVTHRDRTSDELGLYLKGFFREESLASGKINGAIYSSVVPQLNPIIERMLQDWFSVESFRVSHDINLPFSIKYPRPYEIGADRLVNSAAVVKEFGGECIIIDLGTATTFCVLDKERNYLGGVIAPGLKLSMDALTKNTAQLPPIIFKQPESILGSSTLESLQSGFFYGWIGMLEKIISEIKVAHGKDFRVYATGGLVSIIHNAYPHLFDKTDPMMTLKGLKILHDLNKRSN